MKPKTIDFITVSQMLSMAAIVILILMFRGIDNINVLLCVVFLLGVNVPLITILTLRDILGRE